MKRNRFCFICLFTSVLVFSSCETGEPGVVGLLLYNNSGNNVACFVADGLNSGFSYPDTLLPFRLNPFCMKESIKDEAYVWSWKSRFNRMLETTSHNVLSVYIFSQDDINHMGWEEIANANNYLVRYDLTLKDLRLLQDEQHDGDIILYYPPSEAMKKVNMWPSYEQIVQTDE